MATVHFSAPVAATPEAAWDFVARYARSEVDAFSVCVAVRREGDQRVVGLADGSEVRERIVTVEVDRRRSVYTVPGLRGVEHHQAEMRVLVDGGTTVLEWTTDVLPDAMADHLRKAYGPMFAELCAAVEAHRPGVVRRGGTP